MTSNKKFGRQSIRLKNYNYATNGYYFVTICTHEKYCFFGDVVNGKMQLSAVGKIAHQYWSEIPQHSKHTYLDEGSKPKVSEHKYYEAEKELLR